MDSFTGNTPHTSQAERNPPTEQEDVPAALTA